MHTCTCGFGDRAAVAQRLAEREAIEAALKTAEKRLEEATRNVVELSDNLSVASRERHQWAQRAEAAEKKIGAAVRDLGLIVQQAENGLLPVTSLRYLVSGRREHQDHRAERARCAEGAVMELYVAASYSKDRLRAKAFIQRCKAEGHTITHDWTDEMPPPAGMSPAERRLVSRRQAEDDIRGAIYCDMLVLLVSEGMRGAWIEVGAALASGIRVLVVGRPEHFDSFVFMALEEVDHVADEDAALAWLKAAC